MKNLILVFAAIAFSAGVYAQTDSKNTNTNQGDMNNKQQNMYNNDVDKSHPKGENDSINSKTNPKDMKNNPNQNMQNKPVDSTYPEGVTDSTKTKTSQNDMNNIQKQNMQNNLADNSYSGGVKDAQKSNQQKNSGDELHADGIMMQNGQMMKVKNGQMTVMQEKSMTMDNGTMVMSNGTCIYKDGTKMTMKEGQHMDMSGNILPMNTNKTKKAYLVPDSTINKK